MHIVGGVLSALIQTLIELLLDTDLEIILPEKIKTRLDNAFKRDFN